MCFFKFSVLLLFLSFIAHCFILVSGKYVLGQDDNNIYTAGVCDNLTGLRSPFLCLLVNFSKQQETESKNISRTQTR